MKAVKFFLIILFLLIPSVYASISLEKFNNVVYNLGDKIFLNGEVSMDKPFRGYLNFVLKCGDSNVKVATLIVDVDNDRKQKFTQPIVVPRNALGECELEGTLNDQFTNEIVEVSKFVGFSVTDELDAVFQLNKNKFQLGETLTIESNVNKKDRSSTSGTATIYFNKGNETLFLDNAAIANGFLEYKKGMDFVPPGDYEIDIEVVDNQGNKRYFDNLYFISVDGTIKVSVNFDKTLYDPGKIVLLNGKLTGSNNELMKNVDVEILFDGKEKVKKSLTDSSSYFTVNYPLSKNIKSGGHSVFVVARADGGNYGVFATNFSVSQIPTKLDLNLNGNSFIPGEDVGFLLGLLDQANDKIESTLNVILIDGKEKIITSGVFDANGEGKLKIPDQYEPGMLKLQVQGYGLTDESSLNVKEYEKLDVNLEGDILNVKNIGNVKYKKPLSIFAGALEKKKNLNLDVGDSEGLSLKKLLPNGLFDVKIPAAGKEFKDVKIDKPKGLFSGLESITGNVAKNIEKPERKIALGLLLFVLIGCGGFLLFIGRKGNNKNENVQNLKREIPSRNFDVQERKSEYVNVKPSVEYGKATQEDIEDFKKRMLAGFKEESQKKTWNEFVRQQEKGMNENKPKGGMFNMFN